MDTIARIREYAGAITVADLLMASAQLFVAKSTEVQAAILQPATKDPKAYRHLKVSHELGALFEAIMVQLIGIDSKYNTYRTGAYRGTFGIDPEPIVAGWDNDDCYEQRLAKVVLEDKVYKSKKWSDLNALHADILAGVRAALANAQLVPKTIGPGGYALGGVSTAPNYNPAAAGASAGSLPSSSSSSSSAAELAAQLAATQAALTAAQTQQAQTVAGGTAARETLAAAKAAAAAPSLFSRFASGFGTKSAAAAPAATAAADAAALQVKKNQGGGTRRRRRNGKGKRAGSRRA